MYIKFTNRELYFFPAQKKCMIFHKRKQSVNEIQHDIKIVDREEEHTDIR